MNSSLSQSSTQGWTAPSSSRGSIDILWSCTTTLLLCSWSCVCCNIPSPDDSFIKRAQRKLWLTAISLIGPEFLLYIAFTQWLSARKSVKEFQALGYQRWTTKHAFYADMGGFRLEPSGAESFPVNSESLIYLIQEDFITSQQIEQILMMDVSTIEDRDKTDLCARTIAVVQSCWFAGGLLARSIEGLAITTLELTVIGFLAPTIATYMCWWYKPRDISTTHTISITASIRAIHDRAGLSEYTKWHNNPLDFVEQTNCHGSVLFHYWINILERLAHPRKPVVGQPWRASQRRDDNDIIAFTNHWKYGWVEVVPTIPYLAINFVAWNWYFPTRLECLLWRVSSSILAATFLIGAVIEIGFLHMWPAEQEIESLRQHRLKGKELDFQRTARLPWLTRLTTRLKICCQKLRNNSPRDDPNLDVSLRLLFPATAFAALYLVCRLYILVEDLASFRAMPVTTFETVKWTHFVPHLA